MIYAGIGARKTPCDILHAMKQVGTYMYKAGHILRSGGAQGADRAFEWGADYGFGSTRNETADLSTPERKEIYLPWKGFNGSSSPHHYVCQGAEDVAALFHPNWSALSQGARRMMGRNTYQMLGADLKTKADFVVCWTPDAKVTGGTGQALRMALYYEIPIINFGGGSLDMVNKALMHILGEDE